MTQGFVSSTSFRRLALLVVLGSVGAGALLLFMASRSPKAFPEMLRSQLTVHENRWYALGQATPFTGVIVDTYESGALKSRMAVSNGLLEGLSEGWFTNGQPQIQETFRAGVSHGLRTKWHDNGRKMSEALVVDGKIEGVFRRWSKDGSLSEEIQMKGGAANGIARAYHPDGSLRAQARLENDRLLEQELWQPGQRRP